MKCNICEINCTIKDGGYGRCRMMTHREGTIVERLGLIFLLSLSLIFFGTGLIAVPVSFAVTDTCPPFFLKTDKGDIINPMTGENAGQPFSTRKTCGTCHDVDKISKGYHFMMDWDKASDDRFKDTDTPWLVSTGLTGSLTTYGFYQLAKKKNTHPDEIDLSVFDFVARVPEAFKGFQKPGCAGCHAGGGMMEFDRDGFRYDLRLAQNPELAETLDGDYYQSQWDKTGVIEPDCFFCHGNRYNIQTRIRQIKALNFKWAGTAASGIGQVTGSISNGDVPVVVYNRRLFNEDGTFYMPDMVFEPEAKNCLLCHESIELGKRGNSWDDPLNPDVHQQAGLTCIDCHTGDISHNFAKGNAMDNTVAEELNNTMNSCRDCHTKGIMGATRMEHRSIRKDHLDKLSCEACHIPELNRSAGGAMFLNTGVFGKYGQPGTDRFGEHAPWKPAYVIREKDKDGIPRITPVNPMLNTLFTNRDADGIYAPLFLSEVEAAYEQCKDKLSNRQVPYDFHRASDIILMLETLTRSLEGNKRFSEIAPHFHTGGNLVSLNDQSSLDIQKDTTWVSRLPFYSISHNVSSVDTALGANGCRDCHSKDAHLFNGRVITDYFGDGGKPVTISMAQFLGMPDSVQKWNAVFGYYLKAGPVIFVGILVLFFAMTAIRLLSDTPGRPGMSDSWPIGSSLVLILIFGAAHLFMIKDAGILTSLFQTLTGASSFLGPFLMLLVIVIYFSRVRRKVHNKKLSIGMHLAGIFSAGTGLLLWFGWPPDTIAMFIVSIIHGISAVVITGMLIILFYCHPGQRDITV